MAQPVSEEELQLKKRARRRLIGAIALVAAVAALLPMVLDSEPKQTSQEVSIQIPPPAVKGAVAPAPGVAAKPPATPKADPGAQAQAQTKVEAKADEKAPPGAEEKADVKAPAAAPVAAMASATPAPKPVEAPPAKTPEKAPSPVAAGTADPALAKAIERITERGSGTAADKSALAKGADKAAAPKAVPGSFFIQVMALADADKARQSQKKIVDGGVRAYTEVVNTGGNKVTRVRAGPFATREEAQKAQARLHDMGFEGKVAAY